jgi:uncharacterized protein with FMN-binding domain
MRRSLVAIAGTALGITLMVGAKLAHTDLNAADVVADSSVDSPADTTSEAASPPSITPKGSAVPTASAKVRTSTSSSPKPGTSTKPPPSSKPAAKYKDGSFTGSAASERYGSITVTVVISGGTITSASASCSCSGESQTISTRAFDGTSSKKGLNRMTLDAQSASISTFSGATYTSGAYKQSLASALSKAKP